MTCLTDKEAAKARVRLLLLGGVDVGEMAKEITQALMPEFGEQFSYEEILAKVKRTLGVADEV